MNWLQVLFSSFVFRKIFERWEHLGFPEKGGILEKGREGMTLLTNSVIQIYLLEVFVTSPNYII